MTDPEIRLLQALFIRENVYPQALVTGFYGSFTEAAVKRFNGKYRLVPQDSPEYGVAGTSTRPKLNERYAILFPATPGTVSLDKNLVRGMRDPDVIILQRLLNRDSETRVAAAGPGSPGNETDSFGSLTEDAVRRFQVKNGIVNSGTPTTTGFGRAGPRTRAELNRRYGIQP